MDGPARDQPDAPRTAFAALACTHSDSAPRLQTCKNGSSEPTRQQQNTRIVKLFTTATAAKVGSHVAPRRLRPLPAAPCSRAAAGA